MMSRCGWRTLLAVCLFCGLWSNVWTGGAADEPHRQAVAPQAQFTSEPVSSEPTLRPVPPPQTTGHSAPPDSLSPADLQKLDRVQLPPKTQRRDSVDGDHSHVRSTIDKLLPNASPAEKEIWADELRDLPLGVVEDLLRFRQQVKPEADLAAPLISPHSHLRVPPPDDSASPPHGLPSEWKSTADALSQLERISFQNLLHQRTIGYRAIVGHLAVAEAVSVSKASVSHESLRGLQVSHVVQSLNYGEFIQTHRPLDVALSHQYATPLFFAVQSDRGVAYTRCGRFEILKDGRLGIRVARESFPVSPEIRVPDDAGIIEINTRGDVVCRGRLKPDEAPSKSTLGRIPLVAFPDPSRLTCGASGLLIANGDSGAAISFDPSVDILEIGCLEQSNVDPEFEQSQLQWVKQMRQQIHDLTSISQQ